MSDVLLIRIVTLSTSMNYKVVRNLYLYAVLFYSLCFNALLKMGSKKNTVLYFPSTRMGGMVTQWLALLPHSARDRAQFPAWVTVCAEFAHSPRVCMGFLQVLQFPPTVQKTCWLGALAMLNSPSVHLNRCRMWRLGDFHSDFIAVLM